MPLNFLFAILVVSSSISDMGAVVPAGHRAGELRGEKALIMQPSQAKGSVSCLYHRACMQRIYPCCMLMGLSSVLVRYSDLLYGDIASFLWHLMGIFKTYRRFKKLVLTLPLPAGLRSLLYCI